MSTRSVHPNPKVNLKKFASDERKTSEQGYVVKYNNGVRKYFKSHKAAKKFQDELVALGHWRSDVKIVNIARQRDSDSRVGKKLISTVAVKFSGLGLTGDELALLVLGRMCEATNHTFRCSYPTMAMRRAAQRALMHKVRAGRANPMTPRIEQALKLKLHVVKRRK